MTYPLEALMLSMPRHGSVLDIGCLGFGPYALARQLGRSETKHYGVDYGDLSELRPQDFVFRQSDLNQGPIPFADDQFDLVVGSHIIEHLAKPIQFFGECARVCKPGGHIYVEAPSERSLLLPGFPFKHDSFFSLSFYDDPTHAQRPWTPQSLHRLARYYSCEPLKSGYRTSWKHRISFPLTIPFALVTRNGQLLEKACWESLGWASYLVCKKPNDAKGMPAFRYYIPANR